MDGIGDGNYFRNERCCARPFAGALDGDFPAGNCGRGISAGGSGGPGDYDITWATATDSNGNVYIAGTTSGTESANPIPRMATDRPAPKR